MTGWKPGKFTIKHYRRGDLLDGEAFALVPERDPAAVPALRAYADATPDIVLARQLRAWADRIEGTTITVQVDVPPRLISTIATLADAVREGECSIEDALFRLSRLTYENA